MKNQFTQWICICTMQLAAISVSFAQSKPTPNILQQPPSNVVIDGDLKEWGDSLRYYNQDNKINYSLANDKENLYMAIRINDYTEQVRILNAGLTLGIDTRGKKKESFSLTFPVGEQGGLTQYGIPKHDNADQTQEDRDELIQARLTKLRGIKVVGFSDIEGNMITTSNTYGIKTAINYDKDGYLVIEAAIPLKFFHVDDVTKNEWAFNFKINGITRPSQGNTAAEQERASRGGRGGGSGGGRGGRGGGRGGQHSEGGANTADRSELSKSLDFWEKFFLAK
ncbi:MAG: hypothetical protein ACXVJN_14125 [Mucilaginibacter sp.]